MIEIIEKYSGGATCEHTLKTVVEHLRYHHQPGQALEEFTQLLHRNEVLKKNMKQILLDLFWQSRLDDVLVETGMQNSSGFFSEIRTRIWHSILPPLERENSLRFKIKQIFPTAASVVWMKKIEKKVWADFIDALGFRFSVAKSGFAYEIALSLEKLSVRLSALSIEPEIAGQLMESHSVRWFLAQNKAVAEISEALQQGSETVFIKQEKLKKILLECEKVIGQLKKNISKNGTSLQQTFLIKRMEQHIERMKLIADLLDERSFDTERLVHFIFDVVDGTLAQNNILQFLSENISLVSYQIAEHKSHTGEHYIANSRSELRQFFISSCIGGLVICFVVIVKLFIHRAHFAPFWEAMAYSLNYAAGFISIQLTGGMLATKQPAMTASAVAASMDSKKGSISIAGLAIATAKVFRSQTASFTGNLLVVFPVSLLLFYVVNNLAKVELVSGTAEAEKMFQSIHPFQSLSLLYAAFTGVFLFLSGIISGYIDTKVIYSKISQRIIHHPFLKKHLSYKRLHSLATYFEKKLGNLSGNIALGFFLGTASFFGFILGLPYDIRHITIASGNFSISAFLLFDKLPLSEIVLVLIGVLGIGFVNFMVSFGLAFYVAVKSRNISLQQYAHYFSMLWHYLKRYPLDFVYAPKQERTEEDLLQINTNR